jgi:hypothetical protein
MRKVAEVSTGVDIELLSEEPEGEATRSKRSVRSQPIAPEPRRGIDAAGGLRRVGLLIAPPPKADANRRSVPSAHPRQPVPTIREHTDVPGAASPAAAA